MGELGVFELLPGKARDGLGRGESDFVRELFRELFGDDVDFAAGLEGDVLVIRMKGHSHGSGQRPGSGGPDDGENSLSRQRGVEFRRVVGQCVLHPDRRTGVVLVFDFSLGKGGAVMDAPVDRAQPLVDEILLKKRIKSLQDDRLVVRRHGGIGLLPAAEDADALELLALQVEILLGVFAALHANVERLHLQFFAAELLIDLDFDGQAVAVPSRDIGSIKSGHGLRLDDEILQALIQSMAKMKRPIRVGRAVVQDVGGGPGPDLPDSLVNPHLLPAGQDLWFILGQIGLHGESGIGQIDSGFQIERHSGGFSQIVDFFHYRERSQERPLTRGARGSLQGAARKALSKTGRKRVQFSSSYVCRASASNVKSLLTESAPTGVVLPDRGFCGNRGKQGQLGMACAHPA